MRFCLAILILFLGPILLPGQNNVSFYATSSHKSIPAGEVFRLEYRLENAAASSFNPPSFQGLKIISGPGVSSQYINNNGQVSEYKTYSYQLLAFEEGQIKIEPASILANGKQMLSNSVTIQITKKRERSEMEDGLPSEEDVFVRLECADTIAHVGQQIVVQLMVYSRVNISSYKMIYEPEFEAFYSLQGRNPRNPAETVEINGKSYEKRALKNYPLFPQQTGDYEIDPVHLNLSLPGKRRTNSFFFSSGPQIPVTTNSLTIKVRDLPPNPPASFSGAVGKYQLDAGIDKNELSTDDAITLQLVISGNGDPKLISAPQIKFDDRFELYDPTLSYESQQDKIDMQYHNKVFEYLLVPLEEGSYEINPVFSYYDTDSMKYVTLTDGPFPVNVHKGRLNRNLSTSRKQLSDEDLSPILKSVHFRKGDDTIMENPVFYSLFGLPILMFILAIRLQRKQKAMEAKDPMERKREQANKVAMSHLAFANAHMGKKDEKSFYKALSNAMLGYVSDKIGLEQADITKNNVAQKLRELGVKEEKISLYIKLLSQSEMALYAGGSSGDMQKRYEEAGILLTEIEATLD
jgi:hypothetical protein